MVVNTLDLGESQRLRLNTLVRLRWLAIVGQSVTVVIVAYGLGFPLPVVPCFALIACSAGLNIYLALQYPSTHRLPPTAAFGILTFDALQLAGLLYMTGGLTNPFSLLMAVPVVVSATSLPLAHDGAARRHGRRHGDAARLLPSAAAVVRRRRARHALHLRRRLLGGAVVARLPSPASTPSASPRKRGCSPTRFRRPNSCCSASSIFPRSTVWPPLPRTSSARRSRPSRSVAREMERALGSDPVHAEDVKLLRSQSERCREILKQLTSLSTEGEAHLARLPLTSLVEEVTAPHRDFGISIKLEPGERQGPEPVGRRNPGVIYGLGNLVENAVDFAKERVSVHWRWNDEQVVFTIVDDGPGFPPEIVNRIGEPYMSTRQGAERGGGLGLGLFIAKTLLERSGATLSFRNSNTPGEGALVEVIWPRAAFLAPVQAAEPMFDTV